MPDEWQYKFVEILEQLNDTNWNKLLPNGCYDYTIKLRGEKGKFIRDPLMDYQRGRRNVFHELEQIK
jgi:hypothetical protein